MKVLQMLSALDGGGIERIVFDYLCAMAPGEVRFDFVKVEPEEGILEQRLRNMGCEIRIIPPIRTDYRGYCRVLEQILREGHYDVLHCNGGYRAAEALRIARKLEVPVRIAHAHTAFQTETAAQKALRLAAVQIVKRNATNLAACGEQAGRWMWGAGAMDDGRVTVIPNAIRTERFSFDPENRDRVRRTLGLENRFVIGQIGRLSRVKNHAFLLPVFREVHRQRPDAVLLLVGRGELEGELRRQVRELHLTECVKFLGVREDMPELLSAMDLFVLPSLFEGVPVTAVEAQANGLPGLLSASVTGEVRINENVQYLPLEQKLWADQICRSHSRVSNGAEAVARAGYDISLQAQKLLRLYRGET